MYSEAPTTTRKINPRRPRRREKAAEYKYGKLVDGHDADIAASPEKQ